MRGVKAAVKGVGRRSAGNIHSIELEYLKSRFDFSERWEASHLSPRLSFRLTGIGNVLFERKLCLSKMKTVMIPARLLTSYLAR